MEMINDSTKYFAEQEKLKAMEQTKRDAGNTMEAASVVNNPNAFGAKTLNMNVADLKTGNMSSTFDLGTTIAKYGGMYKEGGSYTVSPEELQMIMALGGDVEFLD
jgi:heptaprenylglyceryl phosphate synthase